MKRTNWIAGPFSARPAGKPTECFYCGVQLGATHEVGCVIRQSTVIVKLEVEMILSVPEDWSADAVEFHSNESSSCANNLLRDLDAMGERLGCLCGHLKTTFVRDATVEDEAHFKMSVNNEES